MSDDELKRLGHLMDALGFSESSTAQPTQSLQLQQSQQTEQVQQTPRAQMRKHNQQFEQVDKGKDNYTDVIRRDSNPTNSHYHSVIPAVLAPHVDVDIMNFSPDIERGVQQVERIPLRQNERYNGSVDEDMVEAESSSDDESGENEDDSSSDTEENDSGNDESGANESGTGSGFEGDDEFGFDDESEAEIINTSDSESEEDDHEREEFPLHAQYTTAWVPFSNGEISQERVIHFRLSNESSVAHSYLCRQIPDVVPPLEVDFITVYVSNDDDDEK